MLIKDQRTLVMCAFVIFLVGHVTIVALTGLVRNMNHIAMGTDDTSLTSVYLGPLGLVVIVAVNALANWAAWRRPRAVTWTSGPAAGSGGRSGATA